MYATPALLTRMSKPAQLRDGLVDRLRHLFGVATVRLNRDGSAAVGGSTSATSFSASAADVP